MALAVIALGIAWHIMRTPQYACWRFTRAFIHHDAEAMAGMLDYDFTPGLSRERAVALFRALSDYVPVGGSARIEDEGYGDGGHRAFVRTVRITGGSYGVPPSSAPQATGGTLALSLTRTSAGWRTKARAIPIEWLRSLYGEKGHELGVRLWREAAPGEA